MTPTPIPEKGKLVTVDGIDGAGKTQLVEFLCQYLASIGHDHVRTREPGGTPTSARIRQLLKDPTCVWIPATELLLFLADRAQHGADIIRPALAEGKLVVCDRYTDSTLAYQGYGRGLDLVQLRGLNDFATRDTPPDLTILLDVDPTVAFARLARLGAPDRIEASGIDFFRRARDGFLTLAREEPGRIFVVDANKPFEEVARHARLLLGGLLTRPNPS